MREADILEQVTGIIRKVLRRPGQTITAATRARDVAGWDSFAMVSIIMAVQDAFGIELETSDLDEMDNVGDLVRAIATRRSLLAG